MPSLITVYQIRARRKRCQTDAKQPHVQVVEKGDNLERKQSTVSLLYSRGHRAPTNDHAQKTHHTAPN